MQSAYAKLGRAKKHLAELRTDMQNYRDSNAVTFRIRQQKDPLDSAVVIVECVARVKQPPPSEDWGLAIGDILTNLRAALDHALYGHIAARHSLTEKEKKSVQFPVILNAKDWAGVDGRYSKWVDPAVWAHVYDKQPFHQQDPQQGGLHILNDLVNRDKHRTLHVLVSIGEVSFDRNTTRIAELTSAAKPIVDGAVLGRARLLVPLKIDNPSGSEWVELPGETAYIEHIDAAGFGGRPTGALELMERLTGATETFLDELRSKGC
ncbi:hypothetical protein IU451_15445 [Nocardia cyriacigeorgica]|uniref:hypothetical protein n=1 Tax=Nocardia cyriacigeorgica TaxID=135487 RepID=UPI0018958E00|nr:hypothetical protein [Nocardia cyriacigeorgica]MBF6323913.1 hypothetical protein [Nocardia cyriacigeorgica]